MKDKLKVGIISILIAGITFLTYYLRTDWRYLHIFCRGLYFVPVMLAGFWFGVQGGLFASLAICILYFPYALTSWKASPEWDFDRVIDVVLYNMVALIMGILSDRQKADQKIAQEAGNLAAVGKSVAAVAHDMKTPLMAIGGFTLLVKKYIQEDHPHRDKLDIIVEETMRLESMMKDMLDFCRPIELNRSIEDVCTLINECLELVAVEAQKRNIKVECQSFPRLAAAAIDRMRMKRVLINLTLNAVQASPEGATVIVRCYQKKSKIIIDVIDIGDGIPPGQREEIFVPFFSTKKEGTGLGLPIVKKIVEAHHGEVLLLDNPGSGAVFRVILPNGKLPP
ncbi:MAG: ATP-binding protein [Syntrophobacteraceae bacterium]